MTFVTREEFEAYKKEQADMWKRIRDFIAQLFGPTPPPPPPPGDRRPPNIERIEGAGTYEERAHISLGVVATGAPPLTYQWYKDEILLQGNIRPTLTIPNSQRADSGFYNVVVSNTWGSVNVQIEVRVVKAEEPEPPPPPDPDPDPPANTRCPKPHEIKLGFRASVKRALGYRNTFDVTPMVKGACAHKGDPSPNAICAADEGCGDYYNETYGEPEAQQDSPFWRNEPVERQSDEPYILVIATNSPDQWENGRFKYPGKYTVRVSYRHLNYWRCQDVVMGEDGRITGGGTNSMSYSRPK